MRFSLEEASRWLDVPLQALQSMIRLLRENEADTVGQSTLNLLYSRLQARMPMVTAPPPPPPVEVPPLPVAPRLHPLKDVARVLRVKRGAVESVLRLSRTSRFWPRQDAIGDDTLTLLYSTLAPATPVPVSATPEPDAPTTFTLKDAAELLQCAPDVLSGILKLTGLSRFFERDGYLTVDSMALLHARLKG